MKLTTLLIPVVCVLFSYTLRGAEPLAQQYVVVHKVRDLDDPAKAVCVGTPDILQLPSGRLIASMELWLKRPTSGDEGGIDYPNHCKIKASDDGGKTWRQISTNGITWGSLFYAKGVLYMIGNDPHKRDIRIIRSPDDGRTWSKPVTLFDDSRYHGSATPVHVKDGFVYRAFEDMNRGSASLVVAGDLSKDLLDPAAWRMSNKVEPPRDTPSLTRKAATKKDGRDSGGNWFLEGNVIEIRGELYVLLRTRIDVQLTAGLTSVCKLEDDGQTMKYRFVQFYPMPGGQNKFKIIHDEKSGLYWTCSTLVPDPYQPPGPLADRGFAGNPGNMRRILMLSYSIDGLNWFQAGCVAMSKNPLESFHYASPVIVGDDLLVLSRSSIGADIEYRDYTWKTGVTSGKAKLPYNNHDSNMITLHRVKDFRSLALDLKPDFSYSARTRDFVSWTPLFNGGDLTGWRNPYDWGTARVVDGEIQLSGDRKFFLVTDRQFVDFVFEGEILLPQGPANSGFMFRCHVEQNNVWGYQAEVDGSGQRWSGALYDEGRRRSLWPSHRDRTRNDPKALEHEAESRAFFQRPEIRGALKRHDWNQFRITCVGERIRIEVNDITTTDYKDDADAKGYIGLQHHGESGQIYRFRNLRIREFPPSK